MGCGRVGSSVADGLARIGHDVAVIDRDSAAFGRLSPEFTGERVQGMGFDRDVLLRAGIVPPALPAPALLVSITGVLELFGAAGLLLPLTRVAAAVCLLLLMLAMFPANVYAARMSNPPKSMTVKLPLRTAEEIVFLAAAVVVAVGSG